MTLSKSWPVETATMKSTSSNGSPKGITQEVAALAVQIDLLAVKARCASTIDRSPQLEVGWHHLREAFADLDAALSEGFRGKPAEVVELVPRRAERMAA